jgi:hypothetical protein
MVWSPAHSLTRCLAAMVVLGTTSTSCVAPWCAPLLGADDPQTIGVECGSQKESRPTHKFEKSRHSCNPVTR